MLWIKIAVVVISVFRPITVYARRCAVTTVRYKRNHPSTLKYFKVDEREGHGIGGVESASTDVNSHEGGSSHNGRTQEQARSRDNPAMSSIMPATEEQGTEEGEGDAVTRKGKAPARDRRRRGGGLSAGVGATEQPESPGDSSAGKAAERGTKVKAVPA